MGRDRTDSPLPVRFASVLSMTGFASVEATLPDGRSLSVGIRSVNARHLELQVRLPAGLEPAEPELRSAVRAAVRRGHVELTVHVHRDGATASAVAVDRALLAGYVAAYCEAAALVGLALEPDLSSILRMPGVLSLSAPAGFDEEVRRRVFSTVAEALVLFGHARAAEGAALAVDMLAATVRLGSMVEEAGQLRRVHSLSAVDRLRHRLEQLAGEAVELGPERMLAEAALVVARSDVEEELVRLRTHLGRMTALLTGGGEVGKPLEFLLQELNREANTFLSKSAAAAGQDGLRLTELGLAVKVELERLREQVMNLE